MRAAILQLLSCCQDGQIFVVIWCHDHFCTEKGSVLEYHFIILPMTVLLQTPERDRPTNTRRLWGGACHSLGLVRKHWFFSSRFVMVPDMGKRETIFCATKLLCHKAPRENIFMRYLLIINHTLSVPKIFNYQKFSSKSAWEPVNRLGACKRRLRRETKTHKTPTS